MTFQLPKLGYDYTALEPHIDAKTMEIHHSKHHQAYTDKLNGAVKGTELEGKSIEDILKGLDASNGAVRNNGGGFFNHNLFWEIMSPTGGKLTSKMETLINESFGSFDAFKTEFANAAATQFGSGWAWLCVKADGKLAVCSTPNQDNPLMPFVECQGTPILGLDVWEHAYYLNYQNKRPDYIEAFFSVINWDKVEANYVAAV